MIGGDSPQVNLREPENQENQGRTRPPKTAEKRQGVTGPSCPTLRDLAPIQTRGTRDSTLKHHSFAKTAKTYLSLLARLPQEINPNAAA